jgi:hypothetical protein
MCTGANGARAALHPIVSARKCGTACSPRGQPKTIHHRIVMLVLEPALLASLLSATPLPGHAQSPTATRTPTWTCPQTNLGSAVPVSFAGSTTSDSNQLFGSCGGASAPEHAFQYTAPLSDTYVIDTLGSTFDTILYVLNGSCLGAEIGCNDDASRGFQSSVTLTLTLGQVVVIVVDGFGGQSGSFNLHINAASIATPTPAATATVTATASATPTPSNTPSATATPMPAVDIGKGVGRPAGIACVPAMLATGGLQVARTTNDVAFDAHLFSVSGCAVNPAIGPGSAADKHLMCSSTGVGTERGEVFGNTNPIQDGPLYGYTFAIGAGTGMGTYPVPNAPAAFDASGAPLVVAGVAGQIVVTDCTGDCDGSGRVSIGEVVRCLNLFLGQPLCDMSNPSLSCPVADANLDGSVSIGEVTQCVNRFLNGC